MDGFQSKGVDAGVGDKTADQQGMPQVIAQTDILRVHPNP